MSNAIDRHGVSAWLCNNRYLKLADAVMDEKRFPPVQPEITHCRDCKRSSRNRKYGCGLLSRDDDEIVPMFANDFCSYAVRREE